ncbi:MAG: ABC transporter permease [Burkholderiaceae bacterium]|nr:ABC transporter permease [Microbacteriaceae bacterium]
MKSSTRTAIVAVILVPLAFAGLFVASLGDAATSTSRIPAAIVNSDTLVNQTAADGTTTPVFAGRQLVTELTGDDNFAWTITNAADAKAALAAGDVYAVLTVPKNFSASILSLQSASPLHADLSIRTDDAHSYLAGTVAQSVGGGLAAAFGTEITAQYLSGVYSSIGELGTALGTAATGATDIATGASDLGTGLGTLAQGATSAQSGAPSLADGITTYTGGVASLSSGLANLDAGAGALSTLSDGIGSYTSGVSQLSAGIAAASAKLGDSDPVVAGTARATVAALSARLAAASAQGQMLAAQGAGGISAVQSGIAQSAQGAARLAAGSAPLTSGANDLASGLGPLAAGATIAGQGATSLASGATTLAEGLQAGADKVPDMTAEQISSSADVASAPVSLTVDRDNEVSNIGQIVATFLIPFGLWVGALAIFLVQRPVSGPALASTAGNTRVVLSNLGRAATIALAQAVLLTALLHSTVGVDWVRLPATFGFALLMAVAFTAFHYLLTIAFGRRGLVISLFLFALQVTATGGLYPVELLAAPFRVLSPILPLTYGVSGMQAIVAGGSVGTVLVAAVALLLFALVSVLVSLPVVRRVRRASTLRLMAVAG